MQYGNTGSCWLSWVTRRRQTLQNRNGRQNEQQMSCGKLVLGFFFFSFWTWNHSRTLGRCFVWIVAAGRPAGRKDKIGVDIRWRAVWSDGRIGGKGVREGFKYWHSGIEFDRRLLFLYSEHRLVPSRLGIGRPPDWRQTSTGTLVEAIYRKGQCCSGVIFYQTFCCAPLLI